MDRFRKKHLEYLFLLLPLLLAFGCMLQAATGGYQASLPIPMPQSFIGEYSRDGENWLPIEQGVFIPADKGRLTLRGHFERDVTEGQSVGYYSNHIGVTFFINGERIFIDAVTETAGHGVRLFSSMCGRQWQSFRSPGITAEDEIEIRLYNPHRAGNKTAVMDFLQTLCGMPDMQLLRDNLEPYGAPYRTLGGLCAIVSMMLVGAGIASVILRIPAGGTLIKQALITMFAGGFIVFDTIDISFWNSIVEINTTVKHLCIMLGVLTLGSYIGMSFEGLRKKTAAWALGASAALDALLLTAALTGRVAVFDTLPVWIASQLVLCPLLCVLCAAEVVLRTGSKKFVPALGLLMFAGVLLDIFGVGGNIVLRSPWTKILFVILFVAHLVQAACGIVVGHRAKLREAKLQEELENSRIAIMLSQIRPHFLYNVLGTIRGLCREDPMQARRALGDFSDYLRGNMNALSNSENVHFTTELHHIEAYLRLEKMRMGDKLSILYDIREKDFFISPLTIQPLVENAVKHGLFEKGGGTIVLQTRKEGENILISVQDDGVGFDPCAPLKPDEHHAHVGLANVRSRLGIMCSGRLEIESEPGRGTVATVILRADHQKNRREVQG